jgi:mono/diheme cytochrome c family protein
MRNNLLLTGMFCLTLPAVAAAQSAARGQYIVERVGMCADCHTPRDEKGELIHSKALQGFEIGSKPIHPRPWAEYAPPIA